MRLTVITATYNLIDEGRELTFRQAVQSVRDQTHGDVEHLIMDGGSRDGTVEILEAMKSEGHISDYVSQPDKGVYEAMNRGARHASGDYILYLNSDDFYHRVEGLAEVAAAAEASSPDFICSPILILDKPPYVFRVSRSYYRLLVSMPFGHPGMAVRRDVFLDHGGFDESFRIAADYDLILRLISSGATSAVLDEPFVSFRVGGLSDDEAARAEEKAKVHLKNFGHLSNVSSEDWKTAALRKRFPKRALLKMLVVPEFSGQMRKIALYQLIRGFRPRRPRRRAN